MVLGSLVADNADMEPQAKPQKLPQFFKPLLWSYDFSRIDATRHRKEITVNTINYGTWRHWEWLFKAYGVNEVRRIVEETPVTAFRDRALKLVSLLLHINKLNYAPRGIKR